MKKNVLIPTPVVEHVSLGKKKTTQLLNALCERCHVTRNSKYISHSNRCLK